MAFFWHCAEHGPMNAPKKKLPSLGLTLILSDIRTCGGDDVTHKSVIFALLLVICHFHLKCWIMRWRSEWKVARETWKQQKTSSPPGYWILRGKFNCALNNNKQDGRKSDSSMHRKSYTEYKINTFQIKFYWSSMSRDPLSSETFFLKILAMHINSHKLYTVVLVLNAFSCKWKH